MMGGSSQSKATTKSEQTTTSNSNNRDSFNNYSWVQSTTTGLTGQDLANTITGFDNLAHEAVVAAQSAQQNTASSTDYTSLIITSLVGAVIFLIVSRNFKL